MRQITRAGQVLALLCLITATPESRAQSPTETTRAQKSVRVTEVTIPAAGRAEVLEAC